MYIYQIPLECNEMRNTLPIIHILYTYPSQEWLLQPFDVNRTVASNHGSWISMKYWDGFKWEADDTEEASRLGQDSKF